LLMIVSYYTFFFCFGPSSTAWRTVWFIFIWLLTFFGCCCYCCCWPGSSSRVSLRETVAELPRRVGSCPGYRRLPGTSPRGSWGKKTNKTQLYFLPPPSWIYLFKLLFITWVCSARGFLGFLRRWFPFLGWSVSPLRTK
jgi:hypothetical protein